MSQSIVVTEVAPAKDSAGSLDWERIRFVLYIAAFGATVGSCAILVNFLSKVEFPDVPEHMSLSLSLFFGGVGAGAGFIVSAPLAYWMYGPRPTFSFTTLSRRGPRGLLPWLALALGFALLHPLALGLIVPLVSRFLVFWQGFISAPELVMSTLDLVIQIPRHALSGSLEYLFTAFPAGVIFAIGARVIGLLNSSPNAPLARYGASAGAVALSVAVVLAVAYLPTTALARFGAMR